MDGFPVGRFVIESRSFVSADEWLERFFLSFVLSCFYSFGIWLAFLRRGEFWLKLGKFSFVWFDIILLWVKMEFVFLGMDSLYKEDNFDLAIMWFSCCLLDFFCDVKTWRSSGWFPDFFFLFMIESWNQCIFWFTMMSCWASCFIWLFFISVRLLLLRKYS